MSNVDINAVKEFRRFINKYIYPSTIGIVINNIKMCCDCDSILYEQEPQALIKFHSNLPDESNLQSYTFKIHDILKTIFIDYYNEAEISSLIKNQIHTQINDDDLKNILRNTLAQIQYGNPYYLGQLANVTVLNDHNTYLYL